MLKTEIPSNKIIDYTIIPDNNIPQQDEKIKTPQENAKLENVKVNFFSKHRRRIFSIIKKLMISFAIVGVIIGGYLFLYKKEAEEYKNAKDIAAYEKYLANCLLCKKNLSSITNIQILKLQQTRKLQDDVLYQQAKKIGSIESYQKYLVECMLCSNKDYAKDERDKLVKIENERLTKDSVLYETSAIEDTEQSYQSYLDKCELCVHKNDAENRIAYLQEKRKKEERDELLWSQAKNMDSIDSYLGYKNECFDPCNHIVEANGYIERFNRIKQEQEEQARIKEQAYKLAEYFGKRVVNSNYDGGQNIGTELTSYEWFANSSTYELRVRITWNGKFSGESGYAAEGIIRTKSDGSNSSWNKTWSSSKLDEYIGSKSLMRMFLH